MTERKQTPGAIAWRSAMATVNSATDPAALKVAMGKASKILAAAQCGPSHVGSVMAHHDKRLARMLDGAAVVAIAADVAKVRKPRAKKEVPVLVASVDAASGTVESVQSLESLMKDVEQATAALHAFLRGE